MFELQNSPSLRSVTNTILNRFRRPLIHSNCLAQIHSIVMLTSKWPLWNRFMNINLTAKYFNSSDLRIQPILSSPIYYVCLVIWPVDNSKISSIKISKSPLFFFFSFSSEWFPVRWKPPSDFPLYVILS
jgi:hypothetical protein